MKLLSTITNRVKREAFHPTNLSILFNPLFIIRRGLLKSIRRQANNIEGRVLDFGCGSKPYESLFTKAQNYVGVDIRLSGHDHVDSKVDVYYDGKTLPFFNGSFDSVVSFEVLEHVFDIKDTLKEIHRVLKPGGQFLVSTPFAWDEHEAPYDFARYTSFGMVSLLSSSGFKVSKIEKTTSYLLAIFQMFIVYFTQHVFPKNRFFKGLMVIAFIFPLNALALIVNYVLPKNYGYFNNLVILAERCD